MKKNNYDVLLFKNDVQYKLLGLSLKKAMLLLGSIVFSFLIIFSLFISFLAKNWEISSLEQEINDLEKELLFAENNVESLKKDYYYRVVSLNLDSKIKNIVELVNPGIASEELRIWLDMVYENDYEIENNLNDCSINKIVSTSSLNSVKPGMALFLAIGAVESDFKVHSRSRKGAVGGFQVRKVTLKEVNLEDQRDPRTYIKAGISYLIMLLDRYKDYEDQLELTLASYNAGITRVKGEWISTWGYNWLEIEEGLIQEEQSFVETLNYVSVVKGLSKLFSSGDWANLEENFWQQYRKYIISKDNFVISSSVAGGGG